MASNRRTSRAAALLVVMLVGGCAEGSDDASSREREREPDGATLAPGVVVADPQAVVVAEVSDDRVTLPMSLAERYRALAPGAVFVGARGPSGSKNPEGFLRRVKGVTVAGDALVIETAPTYRANARAWRRHSTGRFVMAMSSPAANALLQAAPKDS